MSIYPPMLDFIIDLKEDPPKDYWNYYSFDQKVTNSIDFTYRKILKKQGFLTEIFLKEQESHLYESNSFMSVTKERIPFFQKLKKHRIYKRFHMLRPLKKPKTPQNLQIPAINSRILHKKSKYQRKPLKNPNSFHPKVYKVTIKLEENSMNPLPILNSPYKTLNIQTPSYANFILFLKTSFPLNSSRFKPEDLESFYLIKTLIEIQKQPEMKSSYERAKSIIKSLPAMPYEPHSLPVLNSSLDIDYKLLHLNIESELIPYKPPRRKVVFNEEKSMISLANHFKMPREELEKMFDTVSRYFPDFMEAFKGNNNVVWSLEQDQMLKTGQATGKDRRRTLRRIKFLNSIDSDFFK